ncbi:hypothetical protein [Pseudobdellovibrio sp. HCB154]|uniref:hypothetical protein n=1 Tax=Pseudobdellovibrio sp. HCB154 TaxID=3386277 RepID=UPI0039171072
MKENQGLREQLKREDPIELPMDEMFFDKLHDKIMADVAKTEIKPATSKWAKPWVFLEQQVRYYRPSNNVRTLHVVKMGVVGISLTLGLGLATMSLKLFDMSSQNQMAANNRQLIIEQALENPQDWVEMAASVQNDSDFYAEVLNERLSSNQGVDLQL